MLRNHPKFLQAQSPMLQLSRSHLKITPESVDIHKNFMIALRAQQILQNDALFDKSKVRLQAPPRFCPFSNEVPCDIVSKYRTLDGACNNPGSPMLGRTQTPFKRYMPVSYDDKLNSQRSLAKDGSALPNPRHVSKVVHDPLDTTTKISSLAVTFGQFVDHDFALSGSTSDPATNAVLACPCGTTNNECTNIESTEDPDQACMTLVRSGASFQKFDCVLNAREQLNLISHYIDLSNVYSNDATGSARMRSNQNGLLATTSIAGFDGTFLPSNDAGTCIEETDDRKCWFSGDTRTSQNLPLVSVVTLFLREHNRVAVALAKLNPSWTDENLFQEAKRIVIGVYQNIIYGEWLPIIVGAKMMAAHDLSTKQTGFTKYDQNVNPSISGEFATAAYRFGHSLVRSFYTKQDRDYNELANLTLTSIFLRPTEAFVNGGMDSICRGLLIDPGTTMDPHFTDDLQNHLFENQQSTVTKHFSLSAINIMRGRDHGIATYNQFRKFAGLKEATLFKHFEEIPKPIRVQLRKLYTSPADVDAFTGGSSEVPMPDAIVGPSFGIVIARQFKDLKFGDRFYFEHGNSVRTRFSEPQLNELRKSSMARLMCDHVDMSLIQKNAFLPIAAENPQIECAKIPSMDLSPWKDEKLPTATG